MPPIKHPIIKLAIAIGILAVGLIVINFVASSEVNKYKPKGKAKVDCRQKDRWQAVVCILNDGKMGCKSDGTAPSREPGRWSEDLHVAGRICGCLSNKDESLVPICRAEYYSGID